MMPRQNFWSKLKVIIKITIMRVLVKISIALFLAGVLITTTYASTFIVTNIQVEGLQGLSSDTVLSYLPVHVGQKFDTAQSGQVIKTMYATGLFNDVALSQQGSTLIVRVNERPIISNIDVTGNKVVPKDKLDDVLKKTGLVQGAVFDNSTLEAFRTSLENEYDNQGKYNSKVTTTVTPEPRNRVAIKIVISEGRSVQVRAISIVGNHVFSSRKLINSLPLTEPHMWSFFTHGDLYTSDKLHKSLDALTSYYQDRGYLKFKIDTVQATLTPDRNFVYIIISVTEGPVYTVSGYQIIGNIVLSQTKLQKAINIQKGDVYSKGKNDALTKAITTAYGDMGYAFANVNVVPKVDDANHQVFLTFYIEPGNRVYVRHVNFIGNTKTEDVVLRRATTQMESGLISTSAVKESERQLNLLGYLQNVSSTTDPVAGSPDQVDINYKVEEAPSAQAMASVGYGTDGWVLGAGVNQTNFMGTGKTVGVNFNQSEYERIYSINYNDPYYTQSGIQRGFTLYAQRVTPGNVNIASYTTNMYGGTVNYSIPISANGDFLQLGYGYQVTFLSVGSDPSTQVTNFVNSNGRHFNQTLWNAGWSHNGLDRAIFPTKGIYEDLGIQLSAPGGGTSLDYYKTNYDMNFYQPIYGNYIFTGRAGLGYGAGIGPTHGLPFFANYYAGGIGYDGAVRGYESNTLGPLDSQQNPLGGNKLATGSLGIIFPNYISEDKLRTTLFVDGGNVYTSQAAVRGGMSGGGPRYSAGLSVDWRVPVLNVLLDVSLAKALNKHAGDQLEPFQFNVGTNF